MRSDFGFRKSLDCRNLGKRYLRVNFEENDTNNLREVVTSEKWGKAKQQDFEWP